MQSKPLYFSLSTDVLTVTIEKYKDVFQKANQEVHMHMAYMYMYMDVTHIFLLKLCHTQAHKLDEALSKYFGAPQQVTQQGICTYTCTLLTPSMLTYRSNHALHVLYGIGNCDFYHCM